LWLHDRSNGQTRRLVDNNTVPLNDGGFGLLNPSFSAMAPDNQHVVVTDRRTVTSPISGSSTTTEITVYRTSDGALLSTGEFGFGNALDFYRAEHVGISWLPNGLAFAAPSYVTVFSQLGVPRDVVGIRLFTFNPVTGIAARSIPLSAPRFYDNLAGLPSETHIFPAFSPSGDRLAYFEVFWPNPLLTEPATATLIAASADGSNPQRILTYNPGFYPLGLTWNRDGTRLLFSIAAQVTDGTSWLAYGDAATAVTRAIVPEPGVPPQHLTGLGNTIAYLPGTAFFDPVNLSQIPLGLVRQAGGGFVIRALGLDPSASYLLQSAAAVNAFGPGGLSRTGAQLAAGIPVGIPGAAGFFRLAQPE
jgi:hypothetical protein